VLQWSWQYVGCRVNHCHLPLWDAPNPLPWSSIRRRVSSGVFHSIHFPTGLVRISWLNKLCIYRLSHEVRTHLYSFVLPAPIYVSQDCKQLQKKNSTWSFNNICWSESGEFAVGFWRRNVLTQWVQTCNELTKNTTIETVLFWGNKSQSEWLSISRHDGESITSRPSIIKRWPPTVELVSIRSTEAFPRPKTTERVEWKVWCQR